MPLLSSLLSINQESTNIIRELAVQTLEEDEQREKAKRGSVPSAGPINIDSLGDDVCLQQFRYVIMSYNACILIIIYNSFTLAEIHELAESCQGSHEDAPATFPPHLLVRGLVLVSDCSSSAISGGVGDGGTSESLSGAGVGDHSTRSDVDSWSEVANSGIVSGLGNITGSEGAVEEVAAAFERLRVVGGMKGIDGRSLD
ncbi:hypothetical protein FRC02_012297 [Tulasnella sp. 418]|nr:hypothetical protein FRC02_012297 [Tulasnella sp. 418]